MLNTNDTQEDIIFSWLPNCKDILSKTMNNSNFVFYPYGNNCDTSLKAFDFAVNKNIVENEEEFHAIDQKPLQQKVKKVQTAQKKTFQKTVPNKSTATSKPKFIPQTIQPKTSWKLITEFTKQSLDKLRIDVDVNVETILKSGHLYHISADYEKDRVSAYDPKPLIRFDSEEHTVKFFGNSSTCEDPKIREELQDKADVFITDKLLSVLMTTIFHSRPWHMKVTKVGDKIFFDKMFNSNLDLTTVNESADNPPPESQDEGINNFYNLSCEATLLNEFIKEQVVDLDYPLEEVSSPNPFSTEENQDHIEKVAYFYNLWNVGETSVLVRSQVHSYFTDEEDKAQYLNIFALNEFNATNYKSTNNTPSSLFKKELGNNHLKVTKWGVQSYLGGVNFIKFGFVTRKKLTDNRNHLITGFYESRLQELLNFTNFNPKMAWGIFKQLIEIIKTQQDGTFILMKDLSTNKPLVKLYKTDDLEEEDDDD